MDVLRKCGAIELQRFDGVLFVSFSAASSRGGIEDLESAYRMNRIGIHELSDVEMAAVSYWFNNQGEIE